MRTFSRHHLVLLTLAVAPVPASFAAEPYHPRIDPAQFQATVDHPYFPLVPGTITKYEEKDGILTSENMVEVTHDTKTVAGVQCIVVHDIVTQEGALKEDTYDWYAQAKDGTVWYFGEDTKEYKPSGAVSTAGSWEAGVNGAEPGIVMPAAVRPGEPYRQEYLADKAEDMGQIVAVGESLTVPAGTYTDVVRTKEWSMLESGSESKWYAKGVGVIREVATAGEVATLVSITKK